MMRASFAAIILFTFVMLFTIIGSSTGYATSIRTDFIFSKDSSPYGTSYSEWMGKWWQWHVSTTDENDKEPKNQNSTDWHPRYAYSPEKCAWNQKDENVWFLPDGNSLSPIDYALGKLEDRHCTIPSDRAILVQIYGGGCDYSEDNMKTDADLIKCVNIGLNNTSFFVKVDGIEVMNSNNKEDFLPNPYVYNITYPENNLYTAKPGTYKAMALGYYLFLKPLNIGTHTIEFNTQYADPGTLGEDSGLHRLQNVVYKLTVI